MYYVRMQMVFRFLQAQVIRPINGRTKEFAIGDDARDLTIFLPSHISCLRPDDELN